MVANLARWDPFAEIYSIRDTVNKMFGGQIQQWQPTIDVLDRPEELVLKADLPGLERDNVEVQVDEDNVILKGQSGEENEEKNENYFRRERVYGSFTRVIPLNVAVKPEESKASFKNGVLEVVMPKAEHARARAKRLEIQQ